MMVKKFLLIFQNRTAWRSFLKTIPLVLALFGASYFGFSLWGTLIFLSVALAVYFSLPKDRSQIKISFWFLQIAGLIGFTLSGATSFSALIFWGFAFLSLMLILIAHFAFRDRFLSYGIWNVLFLFLVFAEFFYFDFHHFLGAILLFLFLSLLFEEALRFFGVRWQKRILLVALVLALLGTEIFWFTSFLPLGFVNASVFLALCLLILRDVALFHLQGVLTRSFIFKELTFFVALSILIFAASKWSI